MIRTDTISDARTGQAIRHLVAAAVPGMTVDQVTVLNTDGTLLSSGNDLEEAAPGKMLTLEKTGVEGAAGQHPKGARALSRAP